jgi:cell division protein FtsN
VPLGQPSGIGDGTSAQVLRHDLEVPAGYKLAWEDDRLNPLRGVGTADGQAAQDQVWTRKVPAKAVVDVRRVVLSTQGAEVAPVRVSTKSAPAPAPAVAGGRSYVQVGSFGVPSNAEGAVSRLAALGLPVARSNGRIGGKSVQVVLAGPFGSAGEARAALDAARRAGFGDAFIR